MIITTILNIIELTKTAPGVITAGVICAALFVISLVAAFLTHPRFPNLSMLCTIIFVVSAFGGLVCVGISDECTVPNGEYQYEIAINDDVSFSEVTDKYEIIEQRGLIFLVEEKDDGE